MIRAIHKESGKIVTSFALIRNPEWKDKERETFVAPKPEIGNWKELKEKGIEEVEVSFVKQHNRTYGEKQTDVIPHFRIKTKEAIENPLNESEAHQTAKEGIYLAIIEGNLIINGKNIQEFELIDVDIEQKLSPTKKSVIADVHCKFKERDEILGEGIVFEIQFSPQNEERTDERTYDRVLQGYSVCWLWKGDFKENKLKNNSLEVIPYSKAIKEYFKNTSDNFRREMYMANNIVDESLTEQKRILSETKEEKRKSLTEQKRILSETKEEKRKIFSQKNLLSQEYSQSFQEILDRKIKDSEHTINSFLDVRLKEVEKEFVNRNIEPIKEILKEIIAEKMLFEVTTELKKVYEKAVQNKLKEEEITTELKKVYEKVVQDKLKEVKDGTSQS